MQEYHRDSHGCRKPGREKELQEYELHLRQGSGKKREKFFQGRLKCFQVLFPDREKDLKMKGYAEKRRLLRFEKGNVQATDRKRKKQKQLLYQQL